MTPTDRPSSDSTATRRLRVAQPVGRLIHSVREAIAPSAADVTARNEAYLQIEVFWASILGGAAAFNAAYALRLGATNAQIGLLSSLPALIALLITIPAGHFLTQRARRMPWLNWSLFLHRAGFLLVALIPWLGFANPGAVVVGVLILFVAPAHFFGVGWNSMLADVVPEADRARIFAARNILVAIATTGTTFLASRWLAHAPFPLNYQTLYIIGFTASLVSLYYITRMNVPDSVVSPAAAQTMITPRALWRGMANAFRSQPDFTRIVVNTLAHGIGLWMAAPVYILYYVRQLGATDGWIGLNATLANLTPVIGYYFWQRVVAKRGENWVLKLTISVVGLYPVLVGLTPDLTLILLWTALNGLIAPGVNLGHFPMLLKVCPAADRPLYLGIYTTVMNGGAFVMPLIGVWLAERIGLAPVLVAGGILCLLGSSMFRFWPLQSADSLATRRA